MAPTTRPRTSRTRTPVKESVIEEAQPASPREKRKMSLHPSTIVLLMLLVIATGVAGYFYYQSKHAAQIADSKEIEELTKTIGQFVELPADETPTLATVTDREKLADQTFFLKAENGDKVLIYSNSGKAILYRPSTKKIVDMTSVNVNQPTQEATPQSQAEATPPAQPAEEAAPAVVRVALLNGSQTVGITNVVENQLKGIMANAAVVSKDNAKKNDYVKTIVVDITGKNGESAAKIAQSFQGEVGSLPAGEVAPSDADVLVIIASNEPPTPAPAPEEKKKKN